MDRSFRPSAHGQAPQLYPTASSTERFAQDLLGIAPRNEHLAAAKAAAERERLEWLAAISTEHESQLQRELNAELRAEQQAQAALAHQQWLADVSTLHEFWDPSKHPRGDNPDNTGQFSHTGGSGAAGKAGALAGLAHRRNKEFTDLTGVRTPGMRQAEDLADNLNTAKKIANAAVAGLGTGAKAVINGTATAIKNVVTLGLNDSELEIIGVTKEDRERGYNTAVKFSTASGQILIAVGTGGVATALGKGGSIAKGIGNALIVFDAAGNAVGVVQGTYDASQDHVNLRNGTQIVGGLIGLGANAGSLKRLAPIAKPIEKAASPWPAGFDPAKGFATFKDFKDAFGAAGDGLAWHHIVEQTINSGKFAAEILHNPANLFRLPHGKGSIHARVSGHYSSRQRFTEGLTVREWLSKKSFKEQFEYGINRIKEFGGTEYLPPELR